MSIEQPNEALGDRVQWASPNVVRGLMTQGDLLLTQGGDD